MSAPSSRYRWQDQSSSSRCRPRSWRASRAVSTARADAATSVPIPSPGMRAIRRDVVVRSTAGSDRLGDRDVLGLEELVDADLSALASQARLLHATEGRG